MMMKTLLMAMVLAAGTASAAQLVGTEKLANGYENKVIDCSGSEEVWGDCFSVAKTECGGRGYSIVDKAQRSREEMQKHTDEDGKVTTHMATSLTRVLTVKCATR